MDSGHPVANGNQPPSRTSATLHNSLRILIIGAGARGNAYAQAVTEFTNACVYAVVEPIQQKRETFGRKYIWGDGEPIAGQSFDGWPEFLHYELSRREKKKRNEEPVAPGVDGVLVCTLDGMHAEAILGLKVLNLHMMSEKPLATTLGDCLNIYKALQPPQDPSPKAIFSIGHVLHYSPHNMLLRKLLLEDGVIGEVLSIEHTEPVGWWHFSHSYVRRSRKPQSAGDATNCLSCPAENECIYSARKIYEEKFRYSGNAGWPVHIVDPEIEDLVGTRGISWAVGRLQERLAEDYSDTTPQKEVARRPWFGRCVYESDNDVCDDQVVTITWDDDPLPIGQDFPLTERLRGRGAKTAIFHMIAQTEKQCERRGRVYGSKGEIEYDSKMIRVYDFATSKAQVHYPYQPGGGHGGGDAGLTKQFINAIEAVEKGAMSVEEAQILHIGCTLDDIIRSHAMVFAAEEARLQKTVIDWASWWQANVASTKYTSP
ncbi:MAG: hypothetical protein Q9210_005300 [Variospora velana]